MSTKSVESELVDRLLILEVDAKKINGCGRKEVTTSKIRLAYLTIYCVGREVLGQTETFNHVLGDTRKKSSKRNISLVPAQHPKG